jgi:hypothetical protein
MHARKWVCVGVVLAVIAGALGFAGTAPAKKRGLGNGPPAPARAPMSFDLATGKPIIVVAWRDGKVIALTGTAIAKSSTIRPRLRGPKATRSARCEVNITTSKTLANGKATVRWFGGIGCDQKMFLFGQAYLQESASTIDAVGDHYQKVDTSASSGRNQTVIDKPHPSLYVRHLTNVYFNPPTGSGQIAVYPKKGTVLNGASKCVTASEPGHGLGVHCDLYTNRF